MSSEHATPNPFAGPNAEEYAVERIRANMPEPGSFVYVNKSVYGSESFGFKTEFTIVIHAPGHVDGGAPYFEGTGADLQSLANRACQAVNLPEYLAKPAPAQSLGDAILSALDESE